MAITQSNGQIDYGSGYVIPTSNSTWAATSGTTWDSWTSWNATPVDPLIWTTDSFDFGQVGWFNLNIQATAVGEVRKYEVWVSSTGAFQGEESYTVIEEGDTSIPSFYGRFVRVAAYVYQAGNPVVLRNLGVVLTNNTVEISRYDVNSASLPTWAGVDTTATVNDAKAVDLGRGVGAVLNVQITPHYISTGSGGYSVPGDNYQYFEQFNWGPVCQASIVKKHITTTNTNITSGHATIIKLQNTNGDTIDNTFDILIKALPEQYMSNGSVLFR